MWSAGHKRSTSRRHAKESLYEQCVLRESFSLILSSHSLLWSTKANSVSAEVSFPATQLSEFQGPSW